MSLPAELVLVSGHSGAGKSVALKTFGDLGFEAIDNIPLPSLAAADHLSLAKDIYS